MFSAFSTTKRIKSSTTLLKEYNHMRELTNELLGGEMKDFLAGNAFQACGKKLGLLHEKTLYFNSEEELSVLADYCMFYHFVNGKNSINRFAKAKGNSLNPDTKQLLTVLQQAEYAFLAVERTTRHSGVIVRNIFTNQQELLIDNGLSSSAVPGVLLASTILRFPNFIMTTGAALSVNSIIPSLENIIKKSDDLSKMSKTKKASFVAEVIKAGLQENIIQYTRQQKVA
ncbi:MAG: hypothetical protein ABFQ95_02045 [Pseudomonadota bacterium]